MVTLQHRGVEYTMQVEFDPARAAEELLARAIRNKSRRSISCSGAVIVRMIAQVPTK
jgi:hypothetical protein